jgi:hypothetical protein
MMAEIIEIRRDLTDERIEDFFQLFLREKELAAGEAVNIPPLFASAAGKSEQDVFMAIVFARAPGGGLRLPVALQ